MTEDRKYGGGERRPLRPEPSWDQVLERNAIERLKSRPAAGRSSLDDLPRSRERHYLDIPEEELVRLKWHGLYHDKPKVGSFMLRIKVPAGVLSAAALRAIGAAVERVRRGLAELSTRQNVQLHFVRLPDVPAILRRAGGRRADHRRRVRRRGPEHHRVPAAGRAGAARRST